MRLYFRSSFKKGLRAHSPKIQEAFEARLELFLQAPNHPLLRNHSVERAYPGCRSFNVTGDIRAVYRIHEDVATFILVGTHAQLYG